ncbi:hypothetical protein [Prochlorococcus sp. MIT 1306]|nr:hypothetical protein [Prochlorococcus sp. MIT 1306]
MMFWSVIIQLLIAGCSFTFALPQRGLNGQRMKFQAIPPTDQAWKP